MRVEVYSSSNRNVFLSNLTWACSGLTSGTQVNVNCTENCMVINVFDLYLEAAVRICSSKYVLLHRCFHVKFMKFSTTPFFTEHFQWLPLLYYMKAIEKGYGEKFYII